MDSNRLSSFLFIWVLIGLANFTTQDALEEFVRLKQANYSTWLQANSLDPSPLVSGPSFFQAANNVTNIDVVLSNHGVKGHSGNMVIDYLYGFLPYKAFVFNLIITENVTFFGEYKGNGSMVDGGSISGEGTWSVQVESVLIQSFSASFEILPSGFLNINDYHLYDIPLADKDIREINFENLLENESAIGHEEDIKSAMFSGFRQYLRDDVVTNEHPLRTLWLKYWQEIFLESTMEDIQNA